jgi:hypothetical protein
VLQWPWKLIHLNTGAARPNAGAAGAGKKNQNPGKPKPLEVQLYNLDTDVGEETNVATDNAAKVAELENLMREAWRDPAP